MEEPTCIERHVPDELRLALGDLVIVAADLEGIAYAIARIYRLPDPQLRSAKLILGRLQVRVGELGIPPWSAADRQRLLAWCHASRLLLEQRDVIIHASTSLARGEGPDGKMRAIRWSLRSDEQIESEADHVARLVRLLLKVRRAGMILEHRLGYPSGSGSMPPHYVTFGRLRTPPIETPQSWLDWAHRSSSGA